MTSTSHLARGAAFAAGAAALLALLATPAALAAPLAATLTAEPPTTTTVPYGSYWSLDYRSSESLQYDVLSVEVTGIPGVSGTFNGAGYSPMPFEYFFSLYTSQNSRLIDVGTYSVGANVNAATSSSETLVRATTATPHTLVIEPAKIAVNLQVTPSRADPQNSVVTMSLGGSWINEVACCEYQTADGRAILNEIPAPPAGMWAMTITNASGEMIVEQQFEQVRGDQPSAVYLWTDAPIAESVTVEATFTATGDEARNFTITQSSPVNFTTGEASRPVIELPVVPEAPPVAEPAGVEIPAWALIVLAVIGLGAGASGVVLALQGRPGASIAVSPGTPVEVDTNDIDRGDAINEAFDGWSLSTSADVSGTESTAEKNNDD